MEVGETLRVPVSDPTQVGDARRQVARLAGGFGLAEPFLGRLALVVTELGANLVKHTAEGGEVLARPLQRSGVLGMEILALDRGRGIDSVGAALRDGFSTAGSSGTGLGAVRRQADLFELHSAPERGTAVLARLWTTRTPPPSADGAEVGVVSVSRPGESVCGDGWALAGAGDVLSILVVDGLGHGPGAAEAAGEAIRVFRTQAQQEPEATMRALHEALRPTRGAAAALARVEPGAGRLRYVGVGNIAGTVHADGSRSLLSANGTVGHALRRVQEYGVPVAGGRPAGDAQRRAQRPLVARSLSRPRRAPPRARRGRALPRFRARHRRRHRAGRAHPRPGPCMSEELLVLPLDTERDMLLLRQRAREAAALLGFGVQDQTRIATSASEVARAVLRAGGGGRAELRLDRREGGAELVLRFRGAGVEAALPGDGRAEALGLIAARRVMDRFSRQVDAEGGVELAKRLPPGAAADVAAARRVAGELGRRRPHDAAEELERQNAELLLTLEELRGRQAELSQLNQELADTNRGVVALYAELDERVEQLRRANRLRAQFTSYMSHEFRTPLDSILALSGLLLGEVDGELNEEQSKQLRLLRGSAQDLLMMVDDLLDTARMEAGQVEIRPERFRVADLFSALRATLRPLLSGDGVALHFADAPPELELFTDGAKLSQVLRNFISNALKFTERGEIRVAAEATGEAVRFSVADTGVGIDPADQERIFEDFTRVQAPGRRVKGSGLGLALSRKLARLLGGEVGVESRPGVGSTFWVVVPREYRAEASGG